ncbi:MAG: helix-turn-helix transcriptional regulator [Planctomycetes bacterium]|nr:helix-turn-helix transcriptional regulator [Planctomycetota bacterium]
MSKDPTRAPAESCIQRPSGEIASQGRIGEIERGERNPTLETIGRLVRAFDVEPYELFLFSLKEGRSEEKVDEEVLVNLVRRTDKSVRPYIIQLVQTALRWEQARKK